MTFFPSDEDHKRLRAMKYSLMSRDDLSRHHAYRYGFRRAFIGLYARTDAGLDPDGEFFDGARVRQAEMYFRRKHGLTEPEPEIPPPSSDDAIRTGWRTIPRPLLTTAEKALSDRELAALRQRLDATMAQMAQRMATFTDPTDLKPSRPAPSPPPLADENDPAVRAWMDRLA